VDVCVTSHQHGQRWRTEELRRAEESEKQRRAKSRGEQRSTRKWNKYINQPTCCL
jgi:hypothetical protein